MKKFPILIGFLVAPIGCTAAKMHNAATPQELEDRTFSKDVAIVYFYQRDKAAELDSRAQQSKKHFDLLKELARSKRYIYAQVPFVGVNLGSKDGDTFIRMYDLSRQTPTILILKKGRPIKHARLEGYLSEDAIKNFIQKHVGSDIDELVEERDAYEKQKSSCPTWIHDWYFYWPYQYYGYHHPYYWHDGFHISFGC